MKTSQLGVVLGFANAFAITIAVLVTAGALDALWVGIMIGIPAMIAGVVVGALADGLRRTSPWIRVPILIVLAWVIGVLLAALATQLGVFVSAAVPCLPASIAALLLERGTRAEPAAGLPEARVRKS